eukprot:7882654-Prorocentrum_lima.AAC.1
MEPALSSNTCTRPGDCVDVSGVTPADPKPSLVCTEGGELLAGGASDNEAEGLLWDVCSKVLEWSGSGLAELPRRWWTGRAWVVLCAQAV